MRAFYLLVASAALVGACTNDPDSNPRDSTLDPPGTNNANNTRPDVGPGDDDDRIGGGPDDDAISGGRDTGDAPDPVDGCETYQRSGPYEVGVRTLDLDGIAVEVWYPAADGATSGRSPDVYDLRAWLDDDARARLAGASTLRYRTAAFRDVEASGDGPFPLVLFSHALGGYRSQSTFLTEHLASWGFVVAAPDHGERGLGRILARRAPSGDHSTTVLSRTIGRMNDENEQSASPLAGRIDMGRVGVVGHSAGGVAALRMASNRSVDAIVALAASRGHSPTASKPTLFVAGTADQLTTSTAVERAFEQAAGPRRLVTLDNVGHLAFSDLCAIGHTQGGVLQIARDSGIDVPDIVMLVGRDGCTERDLQAELAWPAIRHYTTAHLRQTLGIDASPRELDADSSRCFPRVGVEVRSE